MKGIVFTELLDMVEQTFGANMVDDVLDDCTLSTQGAYTSVGTYDHTELLQIVSSLSSQSGLSVRDLVKKYGYHLFGRFYVLMPQFFEKPKTAFDFLEDVHDYIHVEVKKLYPDAQLPHFDTKRVGENEFEMIYKSRCPFADLAEGLIEGCIAHFGMPITFTTLDQNTDGQYSRIFTLRRA